MPVFYRCRCWLLPALEQRFGINIDGDAARHPFQRRPPVLLALGAKHQLETPAARSPRHVRGQRAEHLDAGNLHRIGSRSRPRLGSCPVGIGDDEAGKHRIGRVAEQAAAKQLLVCEAVGIHASGRANRVVLWRVRLEDDRPGLAFPGPRGRRPGQAAGRCAPRQGSRAGSGSRRRRSPRPASRSAGRGPSPPAASPPGRRRGRRGIRRRPPRSHVERPARPSPVARPATPEIGFAAQPPPAGCRPRSSGSVGSRRPGTLSVVPPSCRSDGSAAARPRSGRRTAGRSPGSAGSPRSRGTARRWPPRGG